MCIVFYVVFSSCVQAREFFYAPVAQLDRAGAFSRICRTGSEEASGHRFESCPEYETIFCPDSSIGQSDGFLNRRMQFRELLGVRISEVWPSWRWRGTLNSVRLMTQRWFDSSHLNEDFGVVAQLVWFFLRAIDF